MSISIYNATRVKLSLFSEAVILSGGINMIFSNKIGIIYITYPT